MGEYIRANSDAAKLARDMVDTLEDNADLFQMGLLRMSPEERALQVEYMQLRCNQGKADDNSLPRMEITRDGIDITDVQLVYPKGGRLDLYDTPEQIGRRRWEEQKELDRQIRERYKNLDQGFVEPDTLPFDLIFGGWTGFARAGVRGMVRSMASSMAQEAVQSEFGG